MAKQQIRFIDLFAGIGGIRKGFELACTDAGLECCCVFTSEIKPHAIKVLKQNHPNDKITGDITRVEASDIPAHDVLLAGFPCQAFSAAGKRLGFEDTRGTLFFDVARILKEKRPKGFLLENVEGLVNHDKEKPIDKIGRTLTAILSTLEELGYTVTWRVLNASDFGVPQERKRVYIIGTLNGVAPSLDDFTYSYSTVGNVLESGKPTSQSLFVKMLLSHYTVEELVGKSLKDKRGGNSNIHSWDIEIKGAVSDEQKQLLGMMLKERRKKKWAVNYGIEWMDGMPLRYEDIYSFFPHPNLRELLADLVRKRYVIREYPKQKVGKRRIQDKSLPLGYNIVAGKMSFEVNKVLDPKGLAPTLVAMDMQRLYVADGDGIRTLTLREGLRMFGYPDDYILDVNREEGYDLLGNTVVVPVIRAVATRLLDAIN